MVRLTVLCLLAAPALAQAGGDAAVAVAFAFNAERSKPAPKPAPQVDCQCAGNCRCPGAACGPCTCSTQRQEYQCSPECVCGCNEGRACRCGTDATNGGGAVSAAPQKRRVVIGGMTQLPVRHVPAQRTRKYQAPAPVWRPTIPLPTMPTPMPRASGC